MTRIRIFSLQALQTRLDIGQCGQLALIQFLQRTGTHQALGHGVAGEDQVVTAATGHHLGLQGFTAVHHVIGDLDTGFGGELGERILGKVIGPVVQLEGLILGRLGRRGQGAEGQTQGTEQQCAGSVHDQTPG